MADRDRRGLRRGRQRPRPVDRGRPRQAALRRVERRAHVRAAVRAVSRPDLADADARPSSATTSTTRRRGVDLSEAFIDWRPIPKSSNQQQVRFGAFYPAALARERRARLAQPVHLFVLGDQHVARRGDSADRRRMVAAPPARFAGSPHELRAFAAAFYGNDPAGTLLFWRGWSLHDRQTRLGDRLPMPPMPTWDWTARSSAIRRSREAVRGDRPRARRVRAASNGATRKRVARAGRALRQPRRSVVVRATASGAGAPTSLTSACRRACRRQLGLVAQWMSGDTEWIDGRRPNGTLSAVRRSSSRTSSTRGS